MKISSILQPLPLFPTQYVPKSEFSNSVLVNYATNIVSPRLPRNTRVNLRVGGVHSSLMTKHHSRHSSLTLTPSTIDYYQRGYRVRTTNTDIITVVTKKTPDFYPQSYSYEIMARDTSVFPDTYKINVRVFVEQQTPTGTLNYSIYQDGDETPPIISRGSDYNQFVSSTVEQQAHTTNGSFYFLTRSHHD
jgi:hypothetical protein